MWLLGGWVAIAVAVPVWASAHGPGLTNGEVTALDVAIAVAAVVTGGLVRAGTPGEPTAVKILTTPWVFLRGWWHWRGRTRRRRRQVPVYRRGSELYHRSRAMADSNRFLRRANGLPDVHDESTWT